MYNSTYILMVFKFEKFPFIKTYLAHIIKFRIKLSKRSFLFKLNITPHYHYPINRYTILRNQQLFKFIKIFGRSKIKPRIDQSFPIHFNAFIYHIRIRTLRPSIIIVLTVTLIRMIIID